MNRTYTLQPGWIIAGVAAAGFASTHAAAQATDPLLQVATEPDEFVLTSEADTEVLSYDSMREIRICNRTLRSVSPLAEGVTDADPAEVAVPLQIEYRDQAEIVAVGECQMIQAQRVTISPAETLEPNFSLVGTVEVREIGAAARTAAAAPGAAPGAAAQGQAGQAQAGQGDTLTAGEAEEELEEATETMREAREDLNQAEETLEQVGPPPQQAQVGQQPVQQPAQRPTQQPTQQPARPAQAGAQGDTPNVIALEQWEYDEIYADGWEAERLLDATVYGPGEHEIGEVENLLVNERGQIVALIAEIGGFLDIGDTHVAVPWDRVTVRGYDNVVIPVTEENIGEFSLFQANYFGKVDVGNIMEVADDVTTGPQIWKVTELLDDYVLLETGAGYGYVTDVVFNSKGELQTVLVNAVEEEFGDVGVFGFPWYGYDFGWDPGLGYYTLPYGGTEVAALEPFDADALETGLF